ncbi:Piwi-domain-containing protein [Setomelanomma holmii]|uniref:Piwi-domain-containing protein n=1 Tax=Setomelanomma holmii TaxID=210430 RepID=A0A9P4GXE1_9PLEO|nr:Piwi-domain-containing protein [Setomelanomma holmii]
MEHEQSTLSPTKRRQAIKKDPTFGANGEEEKPSSTVAPSIHHCSVGHACVAQLITTFSAHGAAGNSTLKASDFIVDDKTVCIEDGNQYEDGFDNLFEQAKAEDPPTELVVLFSPIKGGITDAFNDFKRTAETRHGLNTICIASKGAEAARYYVNKQGVARNLLPQVMENVSMKLNLKLGNINHSFDLAASLRNKLFLQSADSTKEKVVDTIILGGDVTHPLKGSADPSIAAVVGSVDDHLAKYPGSVRYQEGGTEIIDGAKAMFLERLSAWSDSQDGRLPSNLIYYRDGVGDSMYDDVLTKEVGEIKIAYSLVKAARSLEITRKGHIVLDKPKITVVIVTKRHHVHFYPHSQVRYENCQPGIIVESGVTHPAYFDFYLQSHTPVQGTAKPTYYVVIRNDMDFNAAQIQDFYQCALLLVRSLLPARWLRSSSILRPSSM